MSNAPATANTLDLSPEFGEDYMRQLETLHVVAQKLQSGERRAERRSRKLGSGIEYADHRDYAPGDDFRNIDWNVYRRSDRLLVRLYEEEEDLSVYLLVDTSESMVLGGARKLRLAAQIATALAYVALANLDRVAMATFGAELGATLPPTRGKSQIFKLLQFFGSTSVGGETQLALCAKSFAHRFSRRGLVVVLSDLYDEAGYETGLDTLRYHRFEPVVVQIWDPDELSPTLHGDLRIVDAETRASRDLTFTPDLLARYRKVQDDYAIEVKNWCGTKQIPWFRAAVGTPFDDIVLELIRSGRVLR